MQPRLKSDLPLTSEIVSWFTSLVSPSSRTSASEPSTAPPATILAKETARVRTPASYDVKPLSFLHCDTQDVSSGFRSDLGLSIRRTSSPINISISVPSIMSIQPEQRAASASRKRLSDAGSSKPRWLSQLPMLTADRIISWNSNVQKLMLKANLDLNSSTYSGEVTWFTKWEGQPAKLKFRWSESSPSTVLFDAQMALRSSGHKLRLTGHPHQLHSASLILGPKPQQPDASFNVQPLDISSRSSSSYSSSGRNRSSTNSRSQQSTIEQPSSTPNNTADSFSSSSSTSESPAARAFDQPGLHCELGWNLHTNSPIMSATRRICSNTSNCWHMRQVKAAYDGKGNTLSLSASGGCWNFGMLFPTDNSGPLGLPKLGTDVPWPRMMLTLTPDLSMQ